jgi:hypothetical protein
MTYEIGFFMLLVIFLEVLHYKERRDLYSRLMARDLTEYSSHKVDEAKATVKTEDRPRNQMMI